MLVQSGNWSEAVDTLREYRAKNPAHRDTTLALAKALVMKGEHEKGFILAEEYCNRNPGDISAHTQLGFLYLESGRTEDAWRVCDRLESSSPDNPEVLGLKAGLLMFEGRYYQAREAYEQALEKLTSDPDPDLLVSLFQACWHADEPDAAIAYARAAVRLYPRNLTALAALCVGLLVKNPGEARQYLERAKAIEPNHPQVRMLEGRVLEYEGDRQGAWECIRPNG